MTESIPHFHFLHPSWLDLFYENYTLIHIDLEYKESSLKACFQKKKMMGIEYYVFPEFLPYNIHVRHNDKTQSTYTNYKNEVELSRLFLNEIKKFPYVKWKFPHYYNSFSIFQNRNIRSEYFQSSIIYKQQSKDELLEGLYFKVRNSINYDGEEYSIREISSEDLVLLLNKSDYYKNTDIAKRDWHKLYQNFNDKFLYPIGIYNSKNCLQSAAVLAREDGICYLWMNILPEENMDRHANIKLLWHCILFSLDMNCDFYFDGSSHYKIDKVFRSFTDEVAAFPVFHCAKNNFMKAISMLKI